MPGPAPSGMFAAPAPRRRSRLAVATSASLHVVLLGGLALVSRLVPTPTLPREYRPVTFVMMAPLPVPHEPTPALTLPPAPEIARAKPAPALTVEVPKPEVLPPAPARSEPAPAPPEPVRAAPPVVAPPPAPVKAPPPPVTVGRFADPAPTVHEAAPVKAIQNAGFDAPSPAGKTGDTKTAASVGAFDPAAPGQPAKTARPGVVVAAGFGANKSDAPLNLKQIAEVRPSGFDAPKPLPAAQRMTTTTTDRVEIPVEILFKPAPVYTDEARRLRLEGDVLLDVQFASTGVVSVLQVVRGLGHGLDEAATAAARQIRFKPAQSAGRPIDFRTTVHIVFRLA